MNFVIYRTSGLNDFDAIKSFKLKPMPVPKGDQLDAWPGHKACRIISFVEAKAIVRLAELLDVPIIVHHSSDPNDASRLEIYDSWRDY